MEGHEAWGELNTIKVATDLVGDKRNQPELGQIALAVFACRILVLLTVENLTPGTFNPLSVNFLAFWKKHPGADDRGNNIKRTIIISIVIFWKAVELNYRPGQINPCKQQSYISWSKLLFDFGTKHPNKEHIKTQLPGGKAASDAQGSCTAKRAQSPFEKNL